MAMKIGRPFPKGHIPWNKGVSMRNGGTFKIGHAPYPISPKVEAERRRKISETKKGKSLPWMIAERNVNWNNGSSRAYKIGYYSQEYKDWRKAVFERDEYTCQWCGAKGEYLEAHHIKSFTRFPESRFDIANGLTLCRNCHGGTKGGGST